MKKIFVSDITLKELSQNREHSLLFREKTAIASALAGLGVDAIELAPVNNLREDNIIYGTISSVVKNCTIAIPVGFTADSVQNAWSCISKAEKPRLQVELPVSTVQMEYIYHMKGEKMLEKISELCSASKALCEDVEFVAGDASRTEIDFLISACKTAQNSGAAIITLCDDAGVLLPEEIVTLVKQVKAEISAKVFVKISDRINMSVAVAFAALCAGADGVKTTLVGEDSLITGKIADTIKEKGEQFGIFTDLNSTQIHTSVNELLKKVNKSSFNIERADSENDDEILLDSDSTYAQICDATRALGYSLSEEDNNVVYKSVITVCQKKSSIGTNELEAIIASSAMQAPSTYHLENYTTSCGNLTNSMTQIKLSRNDEAIYGVSIGDGPIDSAFRAIENSIGVHYELDDFRIQSVTEGKEALGCAVVKLRSGGKLYSGSGISSDIVGASIRAYLNALNKIVFEV